MNAICIVQARTGSSRLPGKVLQSLGPHSVLAEVLERCREIPGIDSVCCAIPEGGHDEQVVDEAHRAGVHVARGPLGDVLTRYAIAAREMRADIVMRVTSDCPLIDPTLCGEVLALVTDEGADYGCNDLPPSFPHGLDCEAFTAAALFEAETQARSAHQREHVTPWLRENGSLDRARIEGPGGAAAKLRWTLDWPEDLAFLQALFAVMPDPAPRDWREVARHLEAHPEIAALNAHRMIRRQGQT